MVLRNEEDTMPASYLRKKGLDLPGHPSDKNPDEIYLRRSDLARILSAVDNGSNENAKRDHAIIYLSFFFAMRAGEAAILERRNLRHLSSGIVRIPTLKRNFKVTARCPHCEKAVAVRWTRAGKEIGCRRCAEKFTVPLELASDLDRTPPEVPLPFIEPTVSKYVQTYLEGMPRKQKWLFEGATPGEHLSKRHIQRIFASYAQKAGLSENYGFHSLRHGRGSDIWEAKKDRMLLKDFMRHSSLVVGERYVHHSPEMRQQYGDEFEQRLKEQPVQ
jgi:integrase